MPVQHQTLKELIVNVRFRLGDPSEGTFGRIAYDRVTENVDEMRLLINEAQRAITVACCTPTTSLLRAVKQRIQILSEITEYPLEDDYLQIDSILHVKGGKERPIVERDMKEFPPDTTDGGDYQNYFNDGGYYKYWDVYGVGSFEKYVGVTRVASVNQLYDVFQSFDAARLGDIVHNVSDGSQGLIVEIVPGRDVLDANNNVRYDPGYVLVDSLAGGVSNRFQAGDQYIISSSEEVFETLHVYPKLIFDEVSTLEYTGTGNTFQVNDNFILQIVEVTVSESPSEFEEDDRMVMEVLDSAGNLISSDPASFLSQVGVKSGVNRFEFDQYSLGIRVAEDTEYRIRATVGNRELTITNLSIYSYGSSDHMLLSYSRLPQKLEVDNAICEIPPYALDMLYAQCKVLADMKIRRAREPNPGLLNEVMMEKEKIQDFLWNRTPRGTSHLQDQDYHSQINDADRNFVAYSIGGWG